MHSTLGSKLIQNSKWRGGGIRSFEDIPYSSVWKNIPAINIKDAAKFEYLNADSYYDRMIIYKRIMDATPFCINQPDPHENIDCAKFGSQSYHFLWGYISQLYWQKQSGRLQIADMTINKSEYPDSLPTSVDFDSIDNIHPNAWWGRMNFSLCVTILIAAEMSGLIAKQSIVSGNYIQTLKDYEPGIEYWRKAFEYYKSCNNGNMTLFEYDIFRSYSWDAHTHCLDIAMQLNQPYYEQLPTDEQYLGLGWCRFVEFFAGARWRTDLMAIAELGAGYLPPSILYNDLPIVLPKDEREGSKLRNASSSSSSLPLSSLSTDQNDQLQLKHKKQVLELEQDSEEKETQEQEALRFNLSLQSVKSLGIISPPLAKLQIMFLTQCCKRAIAREHFPNVLCILLFRKGTFWWAQIPVLLWWWILSFVATE